MLILVTVAVSLIVILPSVPVVVEALTVGNNGRIAIPLLPMLLVAVVGLVEASIVGITTTDVLIGAGTVTTAGADV